MYKSIEFRPWNSLTNSFQLLTITFWANSQPDFYSLHPFFSDEIFVDFSSRRSHGFLCLQTKRYLLFFTYFSISLVFLVWFKFFFIYLENTQNFTLFFCLFSIHIIKFCAVSLLMGVVILIILGYFSIFKTCKKSITYCFLSFTQKSDT